jgi:hypothetical protein
MESKDESCLKNLKAEYEKLMYRYGLPEFHCLNELFDIEEIDLETDFLMRKIRRIISEKILNYLKFIEIILNPSNAPLFFFKLIKKLNNTDKENLAKIYEELGRIEVEIIALDLDYSEQKEAEFVKKMFRDFNDDTRIKLLEVIRKLSNGNNDKVRDNNNGYFG